MRTLESYEQDCGLLRIQALAHSEEMMNKVDGALGVASRHIARIYDGVLVLNPAIVRDIECSIQRARTLLGVGKP